LALVFMEKLVLKGITHPGSLELDKGFNSVGRNPTNDFRVPDATVSSFHCELIVSDDAVLVRDLNSTNGTFIDGRPIREAKIQAGQVLRLGHAELCLEVEQVPEPVTISVPRPTVETLPTQGRLADGSLACLYHPETLATVHCPHCDLAFCDECVRVLRLEGGQTRLFCPSCSRPCNRIAIPEPGGKKKPSLFARLTQTIRIRMR
jgi:hypothetical protein